MCIRDRQLAAVQAVHGPVLLLAVPGSGKTTVLITRLAVSYTHLDVYKRQAYTCSTRKAAAAACP